MGSKLPETLMNIGLSTFVSSCFAYVITEFVLNLNGSSFKSANTSKPSQVVTFKDVYGLERPKEVLQETIDFLKNPGRYEDVGCRLRRGIIFYGPPGTGKTLLAKATAGETNSQFISCSASEFCEMYVGVGAKRVRELFEKAREYESTIILIDEIDALGKRRNDFDASDTERNSTLNQILTEMDGFGTNGKILVIAATNRLEMVDAALLRSGRFDLKIQISLPNPQEREGILRLHLSKLKTNLDARTISTIVKRTEHWSGADIEALCN